MNRIDTQADQSLLRQLEKQHKSLVLVHIFPAILSGHAFRHTSASILVNTGVNIERTKRLGAWKSIAIVEEYVDNSSAYNKETSNLIVSSINSSIYLRIKYSTSRKFVQEFVYNVNVFP